MPASDVLTQLRKIVRGLNLESKRIQKQLGISIPQLLCLNHLQKADNFQSTTKAMSEGLTLNPSTISGIVSRLEKRGYVARLPKRDDRRVTYISLTAEGQRLLEKVPQTLTQKLDERLASLPPETRQSIEQSLKTLIQVLEVEDAAVDPINLMGEVDELLTDQMEDLSPTPGPEADSDTDIRAA